MKICITYGLHPNEFTRPYAEDVARRLSATGMYDVSVHRAPFDRTCWGLALHGASEEDVGRAACEWLFVPETDVDYCFDFHTGSDWDMNPREIPAKELKFAYLENEPLILKLPEGAITYTPWDTEDMLSIPVAPQICGYWIEIPQVRRTVPQRMRRAVIDRSGISPNWGVTMHYLSRLAAKAETLKKYPPEVVGRIIADGIEDHIILAPAVP